MTEHHHWRSPQGVAVPGDPLRFAYVTDEAEHRAVSWLAKRIFEYQRAHLHDGQYLTKMIMITMGALLPGVLLQDYLGYSGDPDLPKLEFGTFGVRFYEGPGQPLDTPQIVQPLSINVAGHNVGIIEDLIDLGGTARFVRSTLTSPTYGARSTVVIASYRKSHPTPEDGHEIIYGMVPQDTWIITPRERIETMVKRVPYWAAQGLSKDQCLASLRAIGYPDYLLDEWFEIAWQGVR
jgi:hypoxanthine phosphoribosyltransferase